MLCFRAKVSAVLLTIPFVSSTDAAETKTTPCEARSYIAFWDPREAKWELWNTHSWLNQNSYLLRFYLYYLVAFLKKFYFLMENKKFMTHFYKASLGCMNYG